MTEAGWCGHLPRGGEWAAGPRAQALQICPGPRSLSLNPQAPPFLHGKATTIRDQTAREGVDSHCSLAHAQVLLLPGQQWTSCESVSLGPRCPRGCGQAFPRLWKMAQEASFPFTQTNPRTGVRGCSSVVEGVPSDS